MNPEFLAQLGGMWAFFLFFHFLFDWVFQSHTEAMKKSKPGGKLYLLKHCLVYAGLFTGMCAVIGMSPQALLITFLVLFVSHFIEDTYIPVYWWAKYIRKPTISVVRHQQDCDWDPGTDECNCELMYREIVVETPKHFRVWLRNGRNPLALMLLIGIDQIVHMVFLFVPAYLMLGG